jgi:signal transduction histidine kinase
MGLVLILVSDVLVFIQLTLLGGLLKMFGALVVTFIMLTTRLPDLRGAFRKFLRVFITALIEVSIYTIGFLSLHVIFDGIFGGYPLQFSIGLSCALLLIFNPLLRFIKKWVNRLSIGDDKEYLQLLREYSKNISNVVDMDLLARVVLDLIGERISVEQGAIFTVDLEFGEKTERCYRLMGVKDTEEENIPPGLISIDSPIVKAFASDRKTLLISEIEMLPAFLSLPSGERAWFKSQKMELFVPIHTKDEWIGLLSLGSKTSGGSYSKSDIGLLEAFADLTAVALQNARLVESLMRVNNEFQRAYSAMEEAQTKLERLNRTKSDFISISSHELRTPLTVLSGYSQILLEDPAITENEYYKKVIKGIHDGTSRLHEIVDSMLEVAQIDTRALELQSEPVNIPLLIQQVSTDFKTATTERNLELTLSELNDLPPVMGDDEALHKVFFNLLSNAIKYTPDGGRINVSGAAITKGDERFPAGGVEIIVSDTGIGIDPRYKDLIFSKFYQTGELALHSSGKTKYKGGGSGLGLVIVRGIVQAHRGKVWVESPGYDEENTPGSDFHVILPIQSEEAKG